MRPLRRRVASRHSRRAGTGRRRRGPLCAGADLRPRRSIHILTQQQVNGCRGSPEIGIDPALHQETDCALPEGGKCVVTRRRFPLPGESTRSTGQCSTRRRERDSPGRQLNHPRSDQVHGNQCGNAQHPCGQHAESKRARSLVQIREAAAQGIEHVLLIRHD